MPRLKRVVTVALVAVLVASPCLAVAQPLTPLVLGWEQYFKVEWEPAEHRGKPIVRGYVLNDYGMPAGRIQVLVDALDANGAVIGQEVAWLGGGILSPGFRQYFEVPVAQKSPNYRVSIFAFEWVQVGGGSDRI